MELSKLVRDGRFARLARLGLIANEGFSIGGTLGADWLIGGILFGDWLIGGVLDSGLRIGGGFNFNRSAGGGVLVISHPGSSSQ